MKLTLKALDANFPKDVIKHVRNHCKTHRTRQISFYHRDCFYPDEDAQYTTFLGANKTSVRVGGEWGGYVNIGAIGKRIDVPVGGYVVEVKLFLGHWFCTIYHNNGVKLVEA